MSLWKTTDDAAGEPKFLTAAEKAKTFGVDVAEARSAANRAKGITTPGWVQYTTYTDNRGNVRHKAEVLVAAGSMTGDTGPAPQDDATVADA